MMLFFAKHMTPILTQDLGTTPLGNTGFNCQNGTDGLPDGITITPMIHWIQGVCVTQDLKGLTRFVAGMTEGEVAWKPGQGRHKGIYWRNTAESTCGTLFLWNELEGGFCRVWFSVPGSALERISLKDSCRLIMGLNCHYQAGFTRIDAKVRVPSSLMTPEFAWQQLEIGNFTGVNTFSETTSYSSDGYKSKTTYIGSSGSDSLTRIYDPREKHKVEGCCDIEAQLNDGKAQSFADMVANLPSGVSADQFAQIVAAAAVGQFKLIDRSSGQRASRCPVLIEWQNLLDLIGGSLKIYAGRPVKTFERVRNWFRRQVAPSLAAMGMAYGNATIFSWLRDELLEAQERISPELLALVTEVKNGKQLFET